MYRLSRESLVEITGGAAVPEVFIGYRLLVVLGRSEQAREKFLRELGKETVVAELFKEEQGQYVTSVVDVFDLPESQQLEGVGFCDKV